MPPTLRPRRSREPLSPLGATSSSISSSGRKRKHVETANEALAPNHRDPENRGKNTATPRCIESLCPILKDREEVQQGRQQNAEQKEARGKVKAEAVDIEDLASAFSYLQHTQEYHEISSIEVEEVRRSLLSWYEENRRLLPWRGDHPPYLSAKELRERHVINQEERKRKEGAQGQKLLTAYFSSSAKDEKTDKEVLSTSSPSSIEERSFDISRDRREVSAYATWVSEIMLQQTRVETVIGYYERWMDRFPTVQALAEASEEDVNSLWAGLGYYRRARMLHQGAKYVLEKLNGELPRSSHELQAIPGIGPYTAGAIASIAFGQPTALVDGNVIRVLSRLRALGSDAKNNKLIKHCWTLADQLVDPEKPGSFNQGLMELGATVCTAKTPQCGRCPLLAHCHAYKEVQSYKRFPHGSLTIRNREDPSCEVCTKREAAGDEKEDGSANITKEVTKYPLPTLKKEVPEETLNVCLLRVGGHSENGSRKAAEDNFLMVRRPAKGLLAGQWEFPSIKLSTGKGAPPLEKETVKALSLQLSGILKRPPTLSKTMTSLGLLVHVFSHVKHNMWLHLLSLDTEREVLTTGAKEVRWMTRQEMKKVGITASVKKALHILDKHLARNE